MFLPDSFQVTSLNSIIQGCKMIVRILKVDIFPKLFDKHFNNFIMTIHRSYLYSCPSVLGHIIWLHFLKFIFN